MAEYSKEIALKDYGRGWSESRYELNYQYEYTAPKWNNSGYVETTLRIYSALLPNSYITVRFSDFGVGVLLPGDTNHYIATSTKNDTPKGEQAASAKNDSNNTVTIG